MGDRKGRPYAKIFYILAWLPEKGNHHFPMSRKTNAGGVTMQEKKEEKIITDPNGSYTGLVKEPYEKPVQDADDL